MTNTEDVQGIKEALAAATDKFNAAVDAIEAAQDDLLDKAETLAAELDAGPPPPPPPPTPAVRTGRLYMQVFPYNPSDWVELEGMEGIKFTAGPRAIQFQHAEDEEPVAVAFTWASGTRTEAHTERLAPFDMNGTLADGSPAFYDFTAGTWVIAVAAQWADGTTREQSVTLTFVADEVEPPPPPPPATGYGHREGPREIDTAAIVAEKPAWDGNGNPIDRNGEGMSISRDALPLWYYTQGEWNGRGLYNVTIKAGNPARNIAVHAHRAASMDLIDVNFEGFAETNAVQHHGVVDANKLGWLRALNVHIDGASYHGLEGSGEIRGARVKASMVAFAGNPAAGSIVSDSIFTFDQERGTPNEWHYGAHKSGGAGVRARFERVIFRDGCSWLDLGAQAVYEDCQFEDSESWGLHCEVDKFYDASTPATIVSYCTFRRNSWRTDKGANQHWFNYGATGRLKGGDGNPAHVQGAHITCHMGTVKADHCLIDLNVATEVGWTEWSDGGSRGGQQPPSGVKSSAGSELVDSLVRISVTPGEPVHGLLLNWSHPEWNSWRNVRIEMPQWLENFKFCIVGGRRMTVAQFINDYAQSCELVYS